MVLQSAMAFVQELLLTRVLVHSYGHAANHDSQAVTDREGLWHTLALITDLP
jgi:hypothetical protein